MRRLASSLLKAAALSAAVLCMSGAASADQIPANATIHGGHTYMLYSNTQYRNPIAMQKRCQELGGHLISITSKGEQDFAYSLLKKASVDAALIGAFDYGHQGVFTWFSTETFTYSNWASGEPDNGKGEGQDYVQMRASDGKWEDVFGAYDGFSMNTNSFICEWDYAIIKATSVTLSGKAKIELTQGKTAKLTATVKPSDATNKKVSWKSSNPSVASVSSSGVVTAIKKGKATIIASATDGSGKKDTVEVTVKAVKKPAQVKIKKTSSGKDSIAVVWKKVSAAAEYEVQVVEASKFANKKTITSTVKQPGKNATTVKKSISKLARKTAYYVRVRAIKKIGSVKIPGKYSTAKKVSTK